MELQFKLSGSLIASVEADHVPEIGSEVIIRMDSYKKGYTAGSLLRFKISAEFPPVYDFSEGGKAVVHIDVNEFEVLEEGPPAD
jgi:hypothetical protein